MQYENRQPPEGINVEQHGWVRDFTLLVAGFLAGFLLICWLLLQVISWSAKWIPFSWEQALTSSWQVKQSDEPLEYLQNLSARLAEAGGVDENIQLTVHRAEDPTINAMATLGGHMVVFDGLINAVESEQGLAFVLAHEIAHIQHRHPAQALARGIGLGAITAMVFGQSNLSRLAGFGGDLAMLDYSRDHEREADAWALDALYNLYGHVAGADELFTTLAEQTATELTVPEWLSSHPNLKQRVADLRALAEAKGYPLDGPLSPLPERVKQSRPDGS